MVGLIHPSIYLTPYTVIYLCCYLSKYDAGKAFKNGKSLLRSGHLTNIKTHMINLNVKYCFVRCNCWSEKRLSNTDYDVRVCLHKDTGEVINCGCNCVAG